MSDQAHSSIGKALQILGMDALVVQSDDHRLTGPAVAAALAADPDPAERGGTRGHRRHDQRRASSTTWPAWPRSPRPISCGSTSMAAYGGAALFAPSVRDRFAGIERADSFVVDPHKWLFAPFDCAALIYRHPQLARAVHTQDASYLDVLHTDAPDEWNPSDYAYHLTRRARGLALWFSLAVNGTDLYRDAVEAALGLARQTAARIEETDHLELAPPAGAVRRPVPTARLAYRGLPRLVGQAARRSDRLRDPVEMGGGDRRPHGLPPPGHDHRDCRRDPGHHGRPGLTRAVAVRTVFGGPFSVAN